MNRDKINIGIFKTIWYGLSFCYLSALLYIVFFARRRDKITDRSLNIIPIKKTINNFSGININNQKQVYHFFENFLGNIFLFIPLPFVLVLFLPFKNLKLILITSILTSILIETIQYVLEIGIADIDDILLNTTGALIGILILSFFSSKHSIA